MKTGRGDEFALAAGGPARHVPVLREEVIEALGCATNPVGGLYLDATFGAGGYTRALLAHQGAQVLAIDRDPSAIAAGRALEAESQGRLMLAEGRFSTLAEIAAERGFGPFDGIVFDIGVSSMQLDEPERGFSFRGEGPLDMRMECAGTSAADLINSADEGTLADIFYYFGEERAARRIARAIVADRVQVPFTTTRQLAELIARINPGKPGDIHPATRVFQALRIAVNQELLELVRGLAGAESLLREGGRLVVVTFHSLEDRIVKQFFAARSGRGQAVSRRLPGEPLAPDPTFRLEGRQPIVPGAEEIATNPRARSAKLRFGVRTAAAPLGLEATLMPLATLPEAAGRAKPAQGAQGGQGAIHARAAAKPGSASNPGSARHSKPRKR
ncbi:16S rRNA (cytosine(1402)-N(4))-methyltransferase RsmH [Beijerinckia mobilis]|uniref:16S rRNA (cytosine(1402)-N(4))-methyltransferase RsmH n=1 Tax=Beijerinckia mobilis TaxID=231434 RepID=UPI000A00EB13|nr:16S rRNA (cytosine(1402)-N(4))-methyltransferase RsmH [Beijerinckia mobilis]